MQKRPGAQRWLVLLAIAVELVLSACGTTTSSGVHSATQSPPTATPTPSLPTVSVTLTASSLTVTDSTTTDISGTTVPGATIVMSGIPPTQTATADGAGHFTVHVAGLTIGTNVATIIVSLAGYENSTSSVSITCNISEGAYKANAQSLPYPQLIKDPASLTGTVVHYKGQVFQYDSNTTTSHMIASVTDGGYGYWSDNVWLDLDPSIASSVTQKDIVEFWGSVVGPYTYTTTNNGSLTIPEIHVMYMSLVHKGS